VELARPKTLASGAFSQGSSASQTLGRGLDVLEQVAAGPVALGVIAARLGLSRSTVHRLATSLLERRYLNLAPRRGYSLGPKLLELGSMARCQIGLVRAARPIMEILAETTGDAVLLAVRDGDHAVLADSAPGTRRLAPRLRIGERHDLLRSAAGRALLLAATEEELAAHWARLAGGPDADFLGSMRAAREAGLVLDEAACDPEIAMLAAPVRGPDGAVRGALGIATAAIYRQAGLSAASQRALRDAAAALSAELGGLAGNMHDAWPAGQTQDVPRDARTERDLLNTRQLARRKALRAPGSHTAEAASEDGSRDEDESMKGRDA
jgi:DNA-binding IclR family transcriptional regulator